MYRLGTYYKEGNLYLRNRFRIKMIDEKGIISVTESEAKIDPTEFDVTISALLTAVGAEEYIDIFRKHNIGQSTLTELTDEDLTKLGVEDADIRRKIMDEVQNLPIYEEYGEMSKKDSNFSAIEIAEILDESSQHLYRIYLSLLANTLALKKTKRISDSLLYRDRYASDVAITTLGEITNILNSMDIALHTKMKTLTKDSNSKKNKKMIVGVAGSAVIAILTVLFIKSIKQLK